jgi:hypothetical protein
MINKANIDGNGNVVIQDADNSEITINTNNPEEIRKFFIDFQDKLNNLPKKILEIMESKNSNDVVLETGANVYLSLNFLMSGAGINGITFGVTITNLTKENRFFNTPFFKLSTPFEGDIDTFSIPDTIFKEKFPRKLEYGEVVSESYPIKPESKDIYEKVIAQDPDATLQVIVNTTIGEIYKSNEYKISKLLENFKYAG